MIFFALFLCRLVLAMVFFVAAFTKWFDRAGFRSSLEQFGVHASLRNVIVRILPLAELATALALLWSDSARYGAAVALALLTTFTVVLAWSLSRGRKPACRCFGQLASTSVGPRTLLRNTCFAALALAVAAGGAGYHPDSLTTVLLVVVVAVVTGQYWLIGQLWLQQGRLLVRIEGLGGSA